ncbi:uncharacterized protein LOC110831104 [Zootermopsis nevadensis]|uniref:Uncharacterized protein n=1 Tax=Zootermopsis nevadensis TaxID=136037 RepID=A0A067RGE3_ZOONE|nr:uncharacterized protein LOC110831104 [Zootermopsis nevadensis]KDR18174.1 hypothetical protein L798_06924 [Zootermopsis nevadensis]
MANLSTRVVMKISIMAAVLFLAVQTANAIMCYQCNSGRDPGCADLTNKSSKSSYYRLCEPFEGQTKPFFCRTNVQTIKDRENLVRVVRSCGWEEHPRKKCYEYEDEDHQERVCQCSEDGCNSKAPHVLKPSALSFLVSLLPLALIHSSLV